MKISIILFLMVVSFGFMNCSKETTGEIHPVGKINLDSIFIAHSMKGWELYSWPYGKDWNFSILMGTNRVKSYEEVLTNKIIVSGKDSLKMLLDKFPQNETIFWVAKEWLGKSPDTNFKLPDNKIVNEIKEYCNQKKLELRIGSL